MDKTCDILNNLDGEQRVACTAPYKNTIIRANAGSGKTRVIAHRVAYMVNDGIDESLIMLLTFTNKASREMLNRVKSLLGGREVRVLGGTFHKIANIFLKGHARQLGYNSNYNILDADDSVRVISALRKEYIKMHDIDAKQICSGSVIYSLNSSSINNRAAVADIMGDEFSDECVAAVENICKEYVSTKRAMNVMDFDDLLLNFRTLLQDKQFRERVSERYQYLLVDEFQDINWIQADIISLLNKGSNHLFAVGDENQAIYGWRGSDITYIERFSDMFPDTQEFYITRNYRSDANILKYAEQSINNNYPPLRNRVKITPVLPAAKKPVISRYQSDYEQDRGIVEKIVSLRESGVRLNNIAILVRTNYLANFLERCLRERGVPYRLLAGLSFFERRHVKDMLCFLRLVNNPNDEVAFTRICDLYEGIGPKYAESAFQCFRDNAFSFDFDVSRIKCSKSAQDSFQEMFSLLKDVCSVSSISDMIDYILFDYYDNYIRVKFEDCGERLRDISYLADISDTFESLDDFLAYMSLDESTAETQSWAEADDAITVTTIHRAKGLEWDYVFIPYLVEGCLPHNRSEISEERRLYYVGVTRAKKQLEISYVTFIRQNPCFISPFLYEVDTELGELVTVNHLGL